MKYICHSGGCPGSDMIWENESAKYGIETIAYSFWNHKQESKNQKILSPKELEEGFSHVLVANNSLKRNAGGIMYPYIKNLLSRNWHQVKNSESVFAIGKFLTKEIVAGGTGWAVQMSIDNKKDVFLFDQKHVNWNKFNYVTMVFDVIDYIPKLTENFAGIGTREIDENGINAIKEILKYNFNNASIM